MGTLSSEDKNNPFNTTFYGNDFGSSLVMVISWLLISILGTFLFAGIIAYKRHGSLNYQTLIDKLYVYFYSVGLLYSSTGFQIVALRAFTTLPRPVCTLQLLQLHSATIALCLAFLEIFLLRYLYSCVWKNVGVLNDDFFGRFLVVCNTMLALGYGVVIYATGEYASIALIICDGSSPDSLLKIKRVFMKEPSITVLAVMCGSLICLAINMTIHCKVKKKKRQNPNGITQHHSNNNHKIKKMLGMDFITEMVLVALHMMALVPGFYVKNQYGKGQLSSVPSPLVAFSTVSSLLVFFVVFPLTQYLRNPSLRRHVAKAVKEWWLASKICVGRSRGIMRVRPVDKSCLEEMQQA